MGGNSEGGGPSQLGSIFFWGASATDSSLLLGMAGTTEPHFQSAKGVLGGIWCMRHTTIASAHSTEQIIVKPNSAQPAGGDC